MANEVEEPMCCQTIDKLMTAVGPTQTHFHNKVTVVGVGQVGMACAYSIMLQVSVSHKFIYTYFSLLLLKVRHKGDWEFSFREMYQGK